MPVFARLGNVLHWLDAVGNAISVAFGFLFWGFVAWIAVLVWQDLEAPLPTPAEQAPLEARNFKEAAELKARNDEAGAERELKKAHKLMLCYRAAACKKHDATRLECATAVNFKTCMDIKMGDATSYIELCSGYSPRAPSIPHSRDTPNAVECFFLKHFGL